MAGFLTRAPSLVHKAWLSPTGLTYDPSSPQPYDNAPIDRGETPVMMLPPEVIARDPSDPTTWTKPLTLT